MVYIDYMKIQDMNAREQTLVMQVTQSLCEKIAALERQNEELNRQLTKAVDLCIDLQRKLDRKIEGMSKQALKPCPFCGGVAEINHGGFGERFVTCADDKCGGRLGAGVWFTTVAQAIDAWNRRPNKKRRGRAMSDPVLCYVEGNWAYFTTQKLEDQWGDDWDDAPYQHNAGDPYEFGESDLKEGKTPWTITKVAIDEVFYTPCGLLDSPYSVEQINSGVVPWLSDWKQDGIVIYAGTTLSQFCELVRKAGGSVYMEVQ